MSEKSGDAKCLPDSCRCKVDDTAEAVILYPSLGMPMVLGQEQKVCSLIIATGADVSSRFKVAGEDKYRQAMEAHVYIDRHLRLMPIDKPKCGCAGDTKQGELCKDGVVYNVAQKSIRVWHLGTLKDGMLIANRHSRVEKGNERSEFPFAILAPRLTAPEGPYPCLTDLWEVEIDLKEAELEGKITSNEFMNWAWLVETTQAHKDEDNCCRRNFFLDNGTHHEPQDRMIDDYLRRLTQSDRHYDYDKLYEVDLSQEGSRYPLPLLAQGYKKRPQSWHPVIRATKLPLKLGHLTDIHVNVRQGALAESKAQVIDDVPDQPLVGDKVAHTFWSVKALIEQMAAKKSGVDSALLLTGDYIDFNRNIAPDYASPNITIGKQWKDFNILANADKKDSTLYQRGYDDTLMYSLVREAYTKHKMPVFMVNGNHEAYQFPYGISPRFEFWSWSSKLGRLELSKLSTEAHKKKLEEASLWVDGKANEGIPADHNLTIYEATLAYGPTYTHLLTTDNFKAEQFDWFHTLFTPFSDAVLALGAEANANGAGAKQILALLGWGGKENYKNLGDLPPNGGVDAQGAGILPRAVQSFSKGQKLLVKRAKALKGKKSTPVVVGSHFPMINYEAKTALSEKLTFAPSDDATSTSISGSAFNKANHGTCELDQRWFYQEMVFTGAVDWHVSGHSHRAGVYQVREEKKRFLRDEVQVTSASDPGLKGDITSSGKGTCFVVSGSAGSIGIQNLKGELGGGLLRPPSGSWVDFGKGTVEQIKTTRPKLNEKPRLCVILDYLAVMNPGKKIVPIQFTKVILDERKPFSKIVFTLSDRADVRSCLNLGGMKIWLFQRKEAKKGDSGKWISISGTVEESGTGHVLKFLPENLKTLNACLVKPEFREVQDKAEQAEAKKSTQNSKDEMPLKYILQAFCEIPLNKPAVAGADDLNCADPWIFPLEIGIAGDHYAFDAIYHYFRRPFGEKGEVPDWWFRYKYFRRGKGYILAADVIRPKKLAKEF